MTRVDADKIAAMMEASKASLGGAEQVQAIDSPLVREPIAAEIEFPDFAKVDMRVVKIQHAEHVAGADKLLKLTLDLGLGADGKPVIRTVFSGIKSAYQPEQLIGQLAIMVANLKARKMKFGMSEGMILAAGDGKEIFLMAPHAGAQPGTRVT
jgi:methionyl-tRNA synthetase